MKPSDNFMMASAVVFLNREESPMKRRNCRWTTIAMIAIGIVAIGLASNDAAFAQESNGKKPNILFIMGDDIGWMQPSCYHRGLMVGETPNIDRIAAEGGMFMTLLRRVELHRRALRVHHRHAPVPRGHGPAAVAGRDFVSAPRHAVPCPVPVTTSATPPASSARTTSAIIRIRCRRRTGSRNSGATSITWTRCSR